MENAQAIIEDLQKKLEIAKCDIQAMRRYKNDAKRYRWLRDTNLQDGRDAQAIDSRLGEAIDAITIGNGQGFCHVVSPSDIDEVIDRAREKWPG